MITSLQPKATESRAGYHPPEIEAVLAEELTTALRGLTGIELLALTPFSDQLNHLPRVDRAAAIRAVRLLEAEQMPSRF